MSLLSKRNIKKKGRKQMNRPHSITHVYTMQAKMQLLVGGGVYILKSYGQRSIVGYVPWGCKELDMTEATEHTCTHFINAKVCNSP